MVLGVVQSDSLARAEASRSPSVLVATRVKQGLSFAYRGSAFAFKIPVDFVSAPCGSLLLTSTGLPSLFLNAGLHFCDGGDVHLRL